MILDIEQISNELYSASFVIKSLNYQVGTFSLQGEIGSLDALINGKYKDYDFELFRGRINKSMFRRVIKPYIILEDKNQNGMIYQTKYNGGLFKKFDFHQLSVNEKIYDLFPIGFGEEGSKSPLYSGEIQIAQIDKECVVYNDMHNYQVYAVDDYAAYIAVLFVSYMYTIAAYKPGTKIKKSVVKMISTDNNRLLIEKYNPNFIKKISE